MSKFNIRSITSPLVYILIIFTLVDNYLFATFSFKIKLDEFFLLILNIIFFVYFLDRIFIKQKIFFIELLLIIFLIVLSISSLINYNTGLFQKILGGYFLIKSLNIFYLIYRFGIEKKYLYKILNLIIYLAILSFIVQLLQFSFPYHVNTLTIGLIPEPYITNDFIRCSGILGAPNRTAQLFIIAYISNRLLGNNLLNYKNFLFLIGLFLASSNLNIVTFFIILMIDLIKNNKKLLIPSLIVISMSILYFGKSFLYRLNQTYDLAYVNETYFRLFAYFNSFEILKDNPLLGVGPGMYGGSVSAILGSPIHEKYGTFDFYKNALHHPKTIDMFWPHLWGEIGLLGVFIFILIFIYINKKIIIAKKYQDSIFHLNSLLLVLILSGVSMQSIESTFSSIIIYTIIAGNLYLIKKENYVKK